MYKQNGFFITFRHAGPTSSFKPKKRNGITEAFVKVEDENGKLQLVASGKAECSRKDKFNKHVGRIISLGRALHELDIERTIRNQLLEAVS